jgi:hypothetical protein
MLLFGAVGLVAGIGLLRLRPYGRLTALGYLIFGSANALVTWLLPGYADRFSRMMEGMPSYMRTTQPPPSFNPLLMATLTIPMMVIPLYFLIKHKPAFSEPSQLPPPPRPMLSEV